MMEYIRMGKSGMKVSRMALGCYDFGRNIPEEECHRMMDRALELGINFFDTANVYGVGTKADSHYGYSEEIIGNWLAAKPSRRDRIVLNTKAYFKLGQDELGANDEDGFSAYKMRRQLKQSLERLQTDHVDIYTLHEGDMKINWREFWDTYQSFISEGLVYYAGASNFTAYETAKCQEEANHRHMLGLVCEQSRYNLVHKEADAELRPALEAEGITFLAWGPVFGGRLTDKVFHPPKNGRQITQALSEELKEKLLEYGTVCKKYGFREQEVAYAWLIKRMEGNCIILGANSVRELEECVNYLNIHLPEELCNELDRIFPPQLSLIDFYMKV